MLIGPNEQLPWLWVRSRCSELLTVSAQNGHGGRNAVDASRRRSRVTGLDTGSTARVGGWGRAVRNNHGRASAPWKPRPSEENVIEQLPAPGFGCRAPFDAETSRSEHPDGRSASINVVLDQAVYTPSEAPQTVRSMIGLRWPIARGARQAVRGVNATPCGNKPHDGPGG